MFSGLSARASFALTTAREESERLNHYYVGVEHMFLGIADTAAPPLQELLRQALVHPEGTLRLRQEMPSEEGVPLWGKSIIQTPRLRRVLQIAGRLRTQGRSASISPSHLLIAIIDESKNLPVRIWTQLGVDLRELRRSLQGLTETEPGAEIATPRSKTSTPYLDKYGRDLTWLAETGQLDPIIGRDHEIENLAFVLKKKTQNNVLIIGEAGTGKTHLVEGLAQEIVSPKLESIKGLAGKRIIEVDLNALVAGTNYRGDFEARLEAILKEAKNPNVILFMDEFHTVLTAGSASGTFGAGQTLKPYLARGDIRCLGATTNEEYSRYVEKDKAFARRFEIMSIKAPTSEETLQILKGLVETYEQHHNVNVDEDALKACVEYSERFIPTRAFPEKAIELLDTACAQASTGSGEKSEIRREEIARVIFQRTGIRPQTDSNVKEFLAGLVGRLSERIIGQPDVIEEVVNVIRNSRLGLSRPDRPQGIFLFCGTTGVGKSELVRAVSDAMSLGQDGLIEINMSQYTEAISTSALIGAPPAYVGHESGGILTESIRRNPFGVVLLDEIEKAHPDVWKLLLQVFDHGRILDRQGRMADFTNALIFMTSNLGADGFTRKKSLGFVEDESVSDDAKYGRLKKAVIAAVDNTFSAEFRNRLDLVAVFRPLTVPVLRRIVDRELKLIQSRAGFRERRISLDMKETAYRAIIDEGYSAEYGARELNRTIERLLVQPLGAMFARDEIPNNSIVSIDFENNEFNISSKVEAV